ncbi:MAG: gamma-glutamylcyclotransferase family protein [Rhodospirillales bacterium]
MSTTALDCFFYGTLMDVAVLSAVIGRPADRLCRERAFVDGYRRVRRLGATYPILIPMPGARVDGILASGLRPADTTRLCVFEGDDYDLVEIPVRASARGPRRAMAFLARPDVPASSEEWTIADWRRRHRKAYLLRLRNGLDRVPF